ncbi:MAG TPA: SIS domain-containing protein [Roseiflexaceae bacterium]|nr:SIS domain-containing protein [Roseiflexaceae bacterium]HMP42070.1 SIS domain-containing protein [Roseiflexaceae bacterium]
MPPILEKKQSWAIYRDELERQADALLARLPAIAAQADAIADQLAAAPPALLYLTGSGDSYIAALSCQHAFRALARIPAFCIEAFDVARYHAPLFSSNTMIVSTSISGRTLTATASLGAARAAGAPTLLITNTPGSPATELADYQIDLDVPSIDTSGFIPSTMSYQAGMIAQHCLALALGERLGHLDSATVQHYREQLALALGQIAPLLQAHDEPVRNFARRLAGRTPFVIGGGACHGTAFFGEAKVIESAMIPLSVQHVEEWAHIRRFLSGPESPSIFLATPGYSRARMLQIMRDARARGTEVIAVAPADDSEVAAIADEVWPVPRLAFEWLDPFTCAVPMELLAYWCMIERDVRPFYADIQPIQTGLTLPAGTLQTGGES